MCGLTIKGSYYLCNTCNNYALCWDCEFRTSKLQNRHDPAHGLYYIQNENEE